MTDVCMYMYSVYNTPPYLLLYNAITHVRPFQKSKKAN